MPSISTFDSSISYPKSLTNFKVVFESSRVAVISRSAALIAVATSDKSVPVISREKSDIFEPEVIVKAYVPGSSFVRLIFVIPSLLNKTRKVSSQIPFGPYIVIGCIIYVSFSNQIKHFLL